MSHVPGGVLLIYEPATDPQQEASRNFRQIPAIAAYPRTSGRYQALVPEMVAEIGDG